MIAGCRGAGGAAGNAAVRYSEGPWAGPISARDRGPPSPGPARPPGASRRRGPPAGPPAGPARRPGPGARGHARWPRPARGPRPARPGRPPPGPWSRRSGPAEHRPAQDVGLELAQEVVWVAPAVDAQRLAAQPGLPGHHLQDVPGLVGDGLQGGPDQVRPAWSPGSGRPGCRGRTCPSRAPPGPRRPGRSRRRRCPARRGPGPPTRRPPQEPQPVAQPLDGRAGHEHGALQRVGRAAGPPAWPRGRAGHRGEEPGARRRRPGTRCGGGGSSPVPYVFLASPGWWAPWPKRAACWSPAMPATGTPAGSDPTATVSPNAPMDGRTSGQHRQRQTEVARGRGPSSVGGGRSSSVREALVASVAWTRPPVSRHRSQLSTVPKASSPGRAGPAPGIVLEEPARAWCPRSRGRARARSSRGPGAPGPSACSRSQRSAVRRHCQTMAR